MSRRGSSTEELQENRKGNLFGDFLNKVKGSYDGVSFKDFLPAPLRINYDITQGQFPYQEELTSMVSFLNKGKKDEKRNREKSSRDNRR